MNTEKDLETFTPSIFLESPGRAAYALMLVEAERCAECHEVMVAKWNGRPFPHYCMVTFERQLKRAGWELQSSATNEQDEHLCQSCEKAGKATFRCACCGKVYSTSLIKRSFGCPADHLCMQCYEAISAHRWDAECERLDEKHRWDFE